MTGAVQNPAPIPLAAPIALVDALRVSPALAGKR